MKGQILFCISFNSQFNLKPASIISDARTDFYFILDLVPGVTCQAVQISFS